MLGNCEKKEKKHKEKEKDIKHQEGGKFGKYVSNRKVWSRKQEKM